MSWFLLVIAGLFEVGWAVGFKYTEGFTRFWPSVGTAGSMAISLVLLAIAMKELPVGTAYAVWTGIGAVGAASLGMILFQEPRDAARLICLGLIVAGVVGLKVLSTR